MVGDGCHHGWRVVKGTKARNGDRMGKLHCSRDRTMVREPTMHHCYLAISSLFFLPGTPLYVCTIWPAFKLVINARFFLLQICDHAILEMTSYHLIHHDSDDVVTQYELHERV